MRPVPLLLLPALAVAGAACSSEVKPRNVVFVCVDTLRADFLGAYGAEPSISPRIDAFARDAVVFENAHSAASWTLPSFASVLTSLYSSTHGCWNFESRLSGDFETLVEVFQDAGFDTHGVASHVYFNRRYGLQQGFDTFDDELAKKRAEGEGWVMVTSGLVTEKAARWLRERGDDADPFLLFVHYFDPHLPYVAHGATTEAEARGLSELERYEREITFTDGHVGELLDALEAGGHADDTVVVFLSDHGEAFEEHPGIRRHSYSLYTEELRIPLMIRVPGMTPRRVEGFVRNVDLRPTLLSLFGLSSGQIQAGVDLLPAMRGERHESPPLVAEIRLKDGHHANALVQGEWKLIENVSRGGFELYDRESDPEEREDLAAERRDVVERLASELRAQINAARVLGERFDAGEKVEHTPEEREHLRDLGYASDE